MMPAMKKITAGSLYAKWKNSPAIQVEFADIQNSTAKF